MWTFIKISIFFLLACNLPAENEKQRDIKDEYKKNVGNISFIFPSNGYAYENRDKLVDECLEHLKSNLALINLHVYTDTISIQFLNSRQEMKKYTGTPASGIALLEPKKVYVVANNDPKQIKPPIKYELMHMISMTNWGYPGKDSNWMNEGLAAFAENNCNGYNDAEIYRYLLENNMLISNENLTRDFYRQPEMIAYHQAAFITQYLLTVYGVDKFRILWTAGFSDFQKIYGTSFSNVITSINKKAKQDYRLAPDINWNNFQKGCF